MVPCGTSEVLILATGSEMQIGHVAVRAIRTGMGAVVVRSVEESETQRHEHFRINSYIGVSLGQAIEVSG
jgi:hypothetical protein